MAFSVLAQEEPLPEEYQAQQFAELPDLPQIHHHVGESNENTGEETKEVIAPKLGDEVKLKAVEQVKNEQVILKKQQEEKAIENLVEQVYSAPNLPKEEAQKELKEADAGSKDEEVKESFSPTVESQISKDNVEPNADIFDPTEDDEAYTITIDSSKLEANSGKPLTSKKIDDAKKKVKELEKAKAEKVKAEKEVLEAELKKSLEELRSKTKEEQQKLEQSKEVAEVKEQDSPEAELPKKILKKAPPVKQVKDSNKQKKMVDNTVKAKSEVIEKKAEKTEVLNKATPAPTMPVPNLTMERKGQFHNYGEYNKLGIFDSKFTEKSFYKGNNSSLVLDKKGAGKKLKQFILNQKNHEFEDISANDFLAIEDISDIQPENKGIKIKQDIEILRGEFNDPFYEEVNVEEVADIETKISDIQLEDGDFEAENIAIDDSSKSISNLKTTKKRKKKSFYLKEKNLKVEVKANKKQVSKYSKYAYEALKVGQYESAISYYREVLKVNPENLKAAFGIATAYHKAGQYENAKDEYLKIINKRKSYIPALNNYLILVSQENPDTAIERLEELRVKNPEFAAIPAQIGSIYYSRGKMKLATDYYFEAVRLEPKNPNYKYNLAIILEDMGQRDYAAQVYKSLLDDAAKGIKLPESPLTIRNKYFSLISEL